MVEFKPPRDSTLLIDTNFLIDYFSDESKYSELLLIIKREGCTLLTIDFVRCEFIRTKNAYYIKKKVDFFKKTIEGILPVDKEISDLLQPTIEQYGESSLGVSVVDFYLACFLKRYKSLYLLTRNHKDFPTSIFSRSHIFHIELEKDIRTYALYSFNTGISEITEEINPADIPF